jgi:hypothetical protein
VAIARKNSRRIVVGNVLYRWFSAGLLCHGNEPLHGSTDERAVDVTPSQG